MVLFSWFPLKWGFILNWYPTWIHPLKWGGFFWVLVAHTLVLLGYSRIKFRRTVETFFFQKTPGVFRFVTLSLEILEKTKLLRIFYKIVLHSLGISRPKTKIHGSSTCFFLIRWKFHSFLLDFWNFHILFNTLGDSMSWKNDCRPNQSLRFFCE